MGWGGGGGGVGWGVVMPCVINWLFAGIREDVEGESVPDVYSARLAHTSCSQGGFQTRGKKEKKKRFLITSASQTNKKLTRNANTSTVALVSLSLKLAQMLQKKFRSNFVQ